MYLNFFMLLIALSLNMLHGHVIKNNLNCLHVEIVYAGKKYQLAPQEEVDIALTPPPEGMIKEDREQHIAMLIYVFAPDKSQYPPVGNYLTSLSLDRIANFYNHHYWVLQSVSPYGEQVRYHLNFYFYQNRLSDRKSMLIRTLKQLPLQNNWVNDVDRVIVREYEKRFGEGNET